MNRSAGSIEQSVTLRDEVRAADVAAVRGIVASAGFFADHEIEVAVDLVKERLVRGEASGYHFVIAEEGGRTVGYACWGPIACTVGSYDLYWIAVHDSQRHRGLGKMLLRASEERIAGAGGRNIYVETSSREQYEPTRRFYERCGYFRAAELADFYAPGDGKVIYVKSVGGAGGTV